MSRAGQGAGKGLEPQERLRELGKGLRLEQRRLRGDLVALHKPLTGGGSRGGRALLPGNRARRRGNGLRLGQGRLRVGSSRNFPMERELRPWQELPREVWSAHPWRCPRKGWRWHSVLWAGDKEGIGAQLGTAGLGGLFPPRRFRDSGYKHPKPSGRGRSRCHRSAWDATAAPGSHQDFGVQSLGNFTPFHSHEGTLPSERSSQGRVPWEAEQPPG